MLFLVILSIAVSSNGFKISGEPAFRQRPRVSYSCKNNDDCNSRLGNFYPNLNFKCCASVLCNDNKMVYYIVSAGCTPEYNCKTDSKQGLNGAFAARVELEEWNKHEMSIIVNKEHSCELTKKAYDQMRSGGVKKPEKPDGATDFMFNDDPCEGRCRQSDSCCLIVRCGRSGKYNFDKSWQCRKNCEVLNRKKKGFDYFSFTLSAWDNMIPKYMKEFGDTGRVEGNCDGTRYFYAYIMKERRKTNNNVRRRQ